MVILQFNKLIRNKWFWGAFAILISAAFCFDDLFTTRDREVRNEGSAGTLGGESVKAETFAQLQEDIRGLGRGRDWKRPADEVNRAAWEQCAALQVAEQSGVFATDADVVSVIRNDRSFAPQGQFSYPVYQAILRENSLTPERYEAFLKRRLTLSGLTEGVVGSAAWASPMELDRAVADMTDVYTVKVASFRQAKEDADKVSVDDAGLKKWYDDNVKSLALPERIRLRMVRFDATRPEVLAKMSVTETEMKDHYDAVVDRYTSTDTNGVETVRKFEEVKDEIEKELRLIAAVQCYETNLIQRVYSGEPDKSVSRLDKIAQEESLKPEVSDWFALEGGYQEGFMKRAYQICPGARDFNEKVAELDSESEDLRYGVVVGEKTVWLVERAEVSPAHTPTLEEAKGVILPRALKDARAEAFKKSVEAIAQKGVEAVAKSGNVSTNITFSIANMKYGDFPDQQAVASAVSKLGKGQISEFTATGEGRGILVICEDRVPADALEAQGFRARVAADIAMIQRRQVPEAWMKWNLNRMGFEANELSSVEKQSEDE